MSTLVYDLLLVPISILLSVFIKFGGVAEMQQHFGGNLYAMHLEYRIILIVCIQMGLLFLFGPKRGLWQFSSFYDQKLILRGTSFAIGGSLISLFFLNRVEYFPRSIFVLEWFILTVFMSLGRFATRFIVERKIKKTNEKKQNIIIYGAGRRGESVLRVLLQNTTPSPNVIGFIDDNPKKKNASIHGYKIIGDFGSLKDLCIQNNVEKIILAINHFSIAKLNLLLETTSTWGTKVYNLSQRDFLWGHNLEKTGIEKISLEELLGRASIHLLDGETESFLKNRVIMVTGAGGSIGSELCMQIMRARPKTLILFEQSEYGLYTLNNAIQKLNIVPQVQTVCLLGSITDENLVESIFRTWRPQLVFHAAAYKHVTLVEENPYCAIQNNVYGTKIVAKMASKYSTQKFILISSDKAVNPTSIMGGTKRLAEIVCQDTYLAQLENTQSENPTCFLTVRFGNVIGSSGSVIPLFKDQIAQGGPVTVTHPKVSRYFMSIPEACHLVIKTSLMGQHNEIFVLDMGEQIKIYDLAKQMIKLAGFVPEKDIDIVFTGLRKGEKLQEEIIFSNENSINTKEEKVKILRPRDSHTLNHYLLEEFLNMKAGLEPYYYAKKMSMLIPEFQYNDEIHTKKKTMTSSFSFEQSITP